MNTEALVSQLLVRVRAGDAEAAHALYTLFLSGGDDVHQIAAFRAYVAECQSREVAGEAQRFAWGMGKRHRPRLRPNIGRDYSTYCWMEDLLLGIEKRGELTAVRVLHALSEWQPSIKARRGRLTPIQRAQLRKLLNPPAWRRRRGQTSGHLAMMQRLKADKLRMIEANLACDEPRLYPGLSKARIERIWAKHKDGFRPRC